MITMTLTSRLVTAFLVTACVIVPVAAQRASNPELLLREALHKQQVEGDLPGAIKIYEQIVAAAGGNRAVLARALFELAGCYEKLGRQAATIYERILRDFADQPAAAQARARLAALKPPAAPTMTLRKIEFGQDVRNVVVADEQRAIYWDDARTTLYVGDVAGRERRVILRTDRSPRPFVSRDLSMIFLIFPPTAQGPTSFAVVKTDGTGYRELTLTENGTPLRFTGVGPVIASWSWDHRFVVIPNLEGNTGRLLRISVDSGDVRDLVPGRMVPGGLVAFSPDGRYVAHDIGYPFGVGIVPADGGESRAVVSDAYFVDWSRDGRYLLVADVSTTTMTISAVGFADGKATGERISLRSVPMGQVRTLPSGALFLNGRAMGRRVISLGTRQPATAEVTWRRLNVVGSPVQYTHMSWSADGQMFAYISREPGTTAFVARLHDITTGDDRELYRSAQLGSCTLGRATAQLFCTLATSPTTMDVISVDLDTRRVERVGSWQSRFVIQHARHDDKALVVASGQTNLFYEWEVDGGRLRELGGYPSDDGRWEFGVVTEPQNRGFMQVRPLGGGENTWTPLAARRLPPAGIDGIPIRFSPDGNWIVYHDRDPEGRHSLYRVSTSGGAPERLGDYPTSSLSSLLAVSPGADRFIVNAPETTQSEVWMLENFLPASTGTTKPPPRASR